MTSGPHDAPATRDLLQMEVGTFLRRTQGRETFHCGPLPGVPLGCVVKRTRATGGRWMPPWRASRARAAGRREHDNLVALARIGVRVPRAIGWAAGERGERASVVVMERVPHRRTLREELERAGAAERRRLGAELLALVARMHAQGWHHRDLYLQHVVLREPDGALVLLDAGRASRSPRARWLVKDLAALLHSTPDRVTPRERLRFVAGWLDALGVRARAARRRWIRAIERKRARIASRVPRDERAARDAAESRDGRKTRGADTGAG